MATNKQRRDAARRHLERQIQRRQEREQARRRAVMIVSILGSIVVVVAVVIFIVAVNGDDHKKSHTAAATSASGSPTASPTSSAPSSSSTAAAASYPCTWTPDTSGATPARNVKAPPTTKPPKTGSTVVELKTNLGALTVKLNRTEAPCTVESFVSLVQQKYFDNTPCHRLTTTGIYVLQCGDPTGTGSGGPGYTIPDEYKSTDKYTTGEIAMANTGQPHSGGSQFFIVYKNSPLPAQYTVFGTVTSGMPVIDKVAKAGSDNSNAQGDGKPKLAISIIKATVAG